MTASWHHLGIDRVTLGTRSSAPIRPRAQVGLLTVEHNGRDAARRRIKHVLEAAGFVRARATLQDDFYAGKRYFAARGWALPAPGGA